MQSPDLNSRDNINLSKSGYLALATFLAALILTTGCDDRRDTPDTENSRYQPASRETVHEYRKSVQPILNNRCVVCHGCFDAPCQLKLSSAQGVNRGSHPNKVYDGTRLTADTPRRLFVDAHSVEAWRELGFSPVLNEGEVPSDQAVLYRMLQLKRQHPLPVAHNQVLPESAFDFSLDRADVCPTQPEFSEYAESHRLQGMPFGLPALPDDELDILTSWLDAGAALQVAPSVSEPYLERIEEWEEFFNEDSLKSQLVARYIYEHLFLANIFFDELAPGPYFKLVRSVTPPGEPIRVIATRRPFDDPARDASIQQNLERVYYRLQTVEHAIVAKNHIPYAFNEKRLRRYQSLFFEVEYAVDSLPSYEPEVAANPFETFAALPPDSRYRFMLEQSKFTIRGFMKGAVCRGQVALNVINDHFWVLFADPDNQVISSWSDNLPKHFERLDLPAERTSNTSVPGYWSEYSNAQATYLKAKSDYLNREAKTSPPGLGWIWQGDGVNQNASLTVFRNFDSAAVVKGLVGGAPKTAWLIDYPVLERIHYLLVAGFDVYGNAGHQLATRLYMDFLRMESEFNFLTLLPQQNREQLRDYWYREADDQVKDYVYGKYTYLDIEPDIDYADEQVSLANLYQLLQQHLQKVLPEKHLIGAAGVPKPHRKLVALEQTPSQAATLMPETGFLMIDTGDKAQAIYTILRNSGHSNITSLFLEKSNRLEDEDYLSVMPGIIGSYPDALWRVEENRIADFLEAIESLEDEADYADLMSEFGIRRSHHGFWSFSDSLHEVFRAQDPVEYGLLDYNRLENR